MDEVIVDKVLRLSNLFKLDVWETHTASLYLPMAKVFRLIDQHPGKQIHLRCVNSTNGNNLVKYVSPSHTTVYMTHNPFFELGDVVTLDLTWIVDHVDDERYVRVQPVGPHRTRMMIVNCVANVLDQFLIR